MKFKTFFENLTGYRLSEIFILLGKTGLIDTINSFEDGAAGSEICNAAGWNNNTGIRFLDALCHLEILEKRGETFFITSFAGAFFLKESDQNQKASLNFEENLTKSWKTLEQVLIKGEREFNTDSKGDESYKKALNNYVLAMDDAAKIRVKELWSCLKFKGEGSVMDIGAGSGAFLCEFLELNKNWSGVFCDLSDVIDIAQENKRVLSVKDRLSFHTCNILENPFENYVEKPDIILLSNVIHCYNADEIKDIFTYISGISKYDTIIIIHDFFKDISWHGALYDLHMMLNTYSGRTYTTLEITDLLGTFGFDHAFSQKLPSHSAFIAFSKERESLDKIREV